MEILAEGQRQLQRLLAVLRLFLEFSNRLLAVDLISFLHSDSPFKKNIIPSLTARAGESLLSTKYRTSSSRQENRLESDRVLGHYAFRPRSSFGTQRVRGQTLHWPFLDPTSDSSMHDQAHGLPEFGLLVRADGINGGHTIRNSRSSRFNRGRGRSRWSTASCCRRARISIAVSCRVRQKTRAAARDARMISSTKPYVLAHATSPRASRLSC